MVLPGIAIMIEWGMQDPAGALTRVITVSVLAAALGYVANRYTSSSSDANRLGGERPLPNVRNQMHRFWEQRRPQLIQARNVIPEVNNAGAAA